MRILRVELLFVKLGGTYTVVNTGLKWLIISSLQESWRRNYQVPDSERLGLGPVSQ
jgi:hypothetical protein